MSEALEVDISKLPRPAAGTTNVPLPKVKEVEVVELPSDELKLYKPTLTRAKLQDHQKHHIAMAVVNGLPNTEIAGMVRHTPKYIKTCIEEDPEIAEYIDHYTSIVLKATVERHFAMLQRVQAADTAIDDCLVSRNDNVKLNAAKFVFESLGTIDGGVSSANDIPTDPAVHKLLTETTMGIHSLLIQIKSGELVADPIDKHLHDTLPGPGDVIGHGTKLREA